MRFAKYHGLGNDFLVVDLRAASEADAAAIQAPNVASALCDRQFGVGGDGVLAILPPVSPGADARMRVLNSDGSEAEMCGNGIRCVARELYERGGIRKPRLAIDTGAGVLACTIGDDGAVTVSMGVPELAAAKIPVELGSATNAVIEQPLEGRSVTCVSMGNPHAVTFVESAAVAWQLARELGPRLEIHRAFPRRTNVEFAHIASRREIDLVVWERGCGITLACGTGACATVVAAVLTKRVDANAPIRVNLPGGALTIVAPEQAGKLGEIAMTGPARHVFDGELDPFALERRPSRTS